MIDWCNDGPSQKFDIIDYGVTIGLHKNLI